MKRIEGSMGGEIDEVIAGAKSLFNALVREDSCLSDYIYVPFNDPGPLFPKSQPTHLA